MKAKYPILLLAALCLGMLTGGTAARAGSPYLFGCSPGLYGGWYGYGPSWEELPYYALYPPVYYRGVVPRTYGSNPTAYLGDVEASEPPASQPLVVINQYVAQTAGVVAPANGRVPAPLLITNPFVKPKPSSDAKEKPSE